MKNKENLVLFKYTVSNDEFGLSHTKSKEEIMSGSKWLDDKKAMKERRGTITEPSVVSIKDFLYDINIEDVNNHVIRDYDEIISILFIDRIVESETGKEINPE